MAEREEDELEAFPPLGRGSSGFGEWEGMKSPGCCVWGWQGSSLRRQPPVPLPSWHAGAQHSP